MLNLNIWKILVNLFPKMLCNLQVRKAKLYCSSICLVPRCSENSWFVYPIYDSQLLIETLTLIQVKPRHSNKTTSQNLTTTIILCKLKPSTKIRVIEINLANWLVSISVPICTYLQMYETSVVSCGQLIICKFIAHQLPWHLFCFTTSWPKRRRIVVIIKKLSVG